VSSAQPEPREASGLPLTWLSSMTS
jgi:hypothetical protein